jgi:hypothetical protein
MDVEGLVTILCNTSNYLTDFSVRLQKIFLLFQDNMFKLENGVICMKSEKILPGDYKNCDMFLAPPYHQTCLDSKVFVKQLNNLFTSNFLQSIHSKFYGDIGLKEDTLITPDAKIALGNDSTRRRLTVEQHTRNETCSVYI